MRVLALLALALLLPHAAARAVAFDLEATDAGFRLRGGDETNPTLFVEAGDEVTIRFENRASSAHNLHVGPPVNASSPCCQPPRSGHELRFVVPAGFRGGVDYWSDADPDGHRGVLLVGDALPRVRIVEPREGADVPGAFDVRIEVENFRLEAFPADDAAAEGRGHVRFVVDGTNASVLTNATTYRVENLAVGHHIVRAELVSRDGSPLDPPAFDEVLVYRRADPATPPTREASITPEERDESPLPALALVVAAVAIASRFRRPPR